MWRENRPTVYCGFINLTDHLFSRYKSHVHQYSITRLHLTVIRMRRDHIIMLNRCVGTPAASAASACAMSPPGNTLYLTQQEFTNFRYDFEMIRTGIDKRLDIVEAILKQLQVQGQQLQVQTRQTRAYMRNRAIKNPTTRIDTLSILAPSGMILEPDFFPRDVKELYSLRTPTMPSQKRLLNYLARFYDILPALPASTSEDESSESDTELGGMEPESIVERLENLFGLDSDKITKFTERAANHPPRESMPLASEKRCQPSAPNSNPPTQSIFDQITTL